eukprot:2192973-Ditylum_brightwellii.AAC.1
MIRNDAQRLWGEEETHHSQESSSQQHHKKIHQTIRNMIRSFEGYIADIDEKDPWTGILSAI